MRLTSEGQSVQFRLFLAFAQIPLGFQTLLVTLGVLNDIYPDTRSYHHYDKGNLFAPQEDLSATHSDYPEVRVGHQHRINFHAQRANY